MAVISDEDLKHLLKVWRECNYNKTLTGRKLGLKKETVRYRINQVAKKKGLLTEEDIKRNKEVGLSGYFQGLGGLHSAKGIKKDSDFKTVKINELIDIERLDHAKIIWEALSKLGKDECVYDDALRRGLGISVDKWKDVKDLEEFLEFQVVLPNKKRVWCHTKTREELLKLDGVKEVY